MQTPTKFLLKALRRLYAIIMKPTHELPTCDADPESVSRRIRATIVSAAPNMIARFGSTELTCLVNYLAIKSGRRDFIGFIRGEAAPWWWNDRILTQIESLSGFFPATVPMVERFCELLLDDLGLINVLGSYRPEEKWIASRIQGAHRVRLRFLDPFYTQTPWTHALANKRVLVIHPFAESIRLQYARKELVFPDGLLPDFTLLTIQAVQSIAGEKVCFPDWFAALESMKEAMDREDYDVALIGCGAYGLPLAAHAKRRGKIGFHIGGSLQLLFGIVGKRWEQKQFVNEYWIRPSVKETPRNASVVENACYW